eukprot:scaffold442_cov485-Pavlova_lutheri.AAC.1
MDGPDRLTRTGLWTVCLEYTQPRSRRLVIHATGNALPHNRCRMLVETFSAAMSPISIPTKRSFS